MTHTIFLSVHIVIDMIDLGISFEIFHPKFSVE